MAAAWIERDLDTKWRARPLALTEEYVEEKQKAHTVIWRERAEPNDTKSGLRTAEEFACALGLLDVTDQWKGGCEGT